MHAVLFRHRALLLALFGAVAVRGLYLMELTRVPETCFPAVDAEFHQQWARALITSRWNDWPDLVSIPERPFLRPPGYPYALAVIYAVVGPSSCIGPIVVQMVLGLASVLLGFALARRLFDDAVAHVAALLMALYWGFVYFEGKLLPPTLLTSLLLAWLLSLTYWDPEAGAPRRCLLIAGASGLLLGVSALVRPNMLVCALPVLTLVWLRRRRAQPQPRPGARGRATATVLAFALATALPVTVTTVRNYRVSGQTVLISANAGVNLLIGNNSRASGLFQAELPGLGTFGHMADYDGVMRRASEQVGHPLNEAQVSRELSSRALRFVRERPGRALELYGAKLRHLLGRAEHGHNHVIAMDRRASITLRSLPGDFGLVLALGLVGFVVARRQRGVVDGVLPAVDWEMCVVVATATVVYAASFLPFFITGQYRIPLVAPLLVFGAAGLVALGRGLARRAWKPALQLFAATALLYAGTVVLERPADADRARAAWEYQRGKAYLRAGALGAAATHFERASSADPTATAAAQDLAFMLERAGRLDDAERVLSAALRSGAPAPADLHTALGNVLGRQGRIDEAEEQFRLGLRLRDDLPTAHTNLASILLAQGKRKEAAGHLRRALHWRSDSPLAARLLREAEREEAPDRAAPVGGDTQEPQQPDASLPSGVHEEVDDAQRSQCETCLRAHEERECAIACGGDSPVRAPPHAQ